MTSILAVSVYPGEYRANISLNINNNIAGDYTIIVCRTNDDGIVWKYYVPIATSKTMLSIVMVNNIIIPRLPSTYTHAYDLAN